MELGLRKHAAMGLLTQRQQLIFLDGHSKTMGSSHSSRVASSHGNELDRRRERAQLEARNLSRTLISSSLVREANLFFVPVLGTDLSAMLRTVCDEYSFALATRDGCVSDYDFLQRCVYPLTADAKWNNAPLAIQELQARQLVSIASFLPRAGPTEASNSNVRVFTQSPVEDRLLALPLFVDERVQRADGAEQLALDTLRHSLSVAERTMLCQCAPMCSVWIYMRIEDDFWQKILITQQASGTPQHTLDQWNIWRAQLDKMFYSAALTFERHSIVVRVHHDTLNVRDVRDPLVSLLSRFIVRQANEGHWSPAPLDGEAAKSLRDNFNAYLSTDDYQRARDIVLTQPRTLIGLARQLGTESPSVIDDQSQHRRRSGDPRPVRPPNAG